MAETIAVRFDILLAYAEAHGLDFNELCRTVRDAIAEGSMAAPLHPDAEWCLREARDQLLTEGGSPELRARIGAALAPRAQPIFVANGGSEGGEG